MSERNLEIVRQIYSEWARGNFRAGPEHYDADTVLVLRPEFPEAGAHRGPEAMRAYMTRFLEAWESVVIEGESFLEAGDSVVVGVHQQAKGKGSGAPVRLRYFHVWTFHGSTVQRIESIQDRSDALEAAGLRE
ncbi:MAG: nuclear transport factor 2 family protein [Solirubrobacterales bacterium]